MLRIFLIRHGQTTQNTGEIYNSQAEDILDFKVPLTTRGEEQAREAGIFLKNYLKENGIQKEAKFVYTSTYDRAKYTYRLLNESNFLPSRLGNDLLVEQNFGLFDGIPKDKWKEKYPREYEHYMKYKNAGGKYFAKFPLGESPMDVSIRCKLFTSTMFSDIQRHGVQNVIIVSHGTTLRCFYKEWFHYSSEWFAEEENPNNCSIRLIEREKPSVSKGKYIFDGFDT